MQGSGAGAQSGDEVQNYGDVCRVRVRQHQSQTRTLSSSEPCSFSKTLWVELEGPKWGSSSSEQGGRVQLIRDPVVSIHCPPTVSSLSAGLTPIS